MNTKSRTSNSILNISITLGCQIIRLILSFATRTIFIKLLGDEFNGINGLFSNILSILSLAELGIGGAITFALYKPIAENDEARVASLMQFYKRAYIFISIAVFFIGICLVPFLDVLVKTEREIKNLVVYYMLYLLNSSCSYLFIYKSALLNADQRSRTVKLVGTLYHIITNIGQIIILILTHSFIAYLIIQFACTLMNNITLAIIANKKYPFLCRPSKNLDKSERKTVLSDIKSIFIYRIAGVVLNNTDSILITTLVGVLAVGFYSNYYMVVGAITTMLELVFSALTGSIGNLNAVGDKGKSERIFKICNFANFWLFGFCSICLFILLDDFIFLWLGKDHILGKLVCAAIVVNVYFQGTHQSVILYRSTTGLFRQAKYAIILASIINIFLSIILGKLIGLAGILFATVISRLMTNLWYEPMVLFKNYFEHSSARYFLKQSCYLAVWVVSGCVLFIISSQFNNITYQSFFIKMLLCLLIPNIIFWLFFHQTPEYRELKNRTLGMLKKLKR